MSARSIRRAHKRGEEHEERRRARLGAKLTGAVGATLGATVLFAPAAQAETFEVTNLDDSGAGSLRDAVIDADSSDDVIVFESGLSGTLELGADIEIVDHGLTIQGPGADQVEIDSEGVDNIFYIFGMDDPDEQVSISGLTLTGGDSEDGGAIESRYDIQNAAELTLDSMVITGNYGSGEGGGVYVDEGSLTITNSIISDNDADAEGGGVYVDDTDGDEDVEVTISQSVVSGNESHSQEGGGVYVDSADGGVLIERSLITDNTSYNEGGGGKVDYADGPITLDTVTVSDNTITDDVGDGENAGGFEIDFNVGPGLVQSSTFSGNSATGAGGGLHLVSDGDGTSSVIQSSTFSGNTAGEHGGGIYVGYIDEDETTTIRNSTIVDNTAGTEGDDYRGGGVYLYEDDDAGGDDVPNGPVTLSSTIVANNTADVGPDLGAGDFTDGFTTGFSLVEAPQGSVVTESPAGTNHFGVDPLLGPLTSNGGPTETHGPSLVSPVLDKGIANGLATDQRGLTRTGDLAAIANAPGGDGTDIGSVEVPVADCKGAGALRFDGTPGDDTLTGSGGPDSISGADGNDRLNGVGAPDCLNGDAGRDRLNGGGGADRINGGPGKDKAKGQGGRDSVRGGGGKDNLKGSGGKDKLRGQGGKDKLVGGGGKDKLKGGAGKDKLRGQGAKDKLKGQGGKDKINAVDGKRDKVNCGGGRDRTTVDAEDKVSGNCERVIVKD